MPHLQVSILAWLQGTQPNALEGVARLIAVDEPFWTSTEVLVQHTDSTAQMKAGRITGYWADQNHRVLQPPRPQAGTSVVCPGSALGVQHAKEDGFSTPLRLLARCNGIFVYDQEASPCDHSCTALATCSWTMNGVLSTYIKQKCRDLAHGR